MEDEYHSDKLHSHSWVPMDGSANYKQKVNFRGIAFRGIALFTYRCKICGETSVGSSTGPTVWATYVAERIEPMSCNDVTVKDILV